MTTPLRPLLLMACLVLVSCSSVPQASNADSGWRFLGDMQFGERDRSRKVFVEKYVGPFTDVQIRVKKVGIRLDRIKVTFANGESWEPITRFVVPGEGSTRDLSLPGAPRRIQSVLVRARAVGPHSKAKVRVYARPSSSSRRD